MTSPNSFDYQETNRSSIQLPALGFEEGRRAGKTSSTASLLMRHERYDSLPLHSPTADNTPTTLNFPGLGLEEMLSPDARITPAAAATGDAGLESKLKLLEEVKRARESVHSSLERIRAGTPTPSVNQALPSPTTSVTPGLARPVSSVDMRSRRGSATSSRMLDDPRLATQSEWDDYVQSRKVITPPVNNSPSLNTPAMIRGASQNSHYAVVSDSVARAVNRRERTTSMMDLSVPEQGEWGPREMLETTPASVGMGRRALSYHEAPANVSYEGRPQYRESNSYASMRDSGEYASRSRQSSGPRTMTNEELAERHRKRLSALQQPVTAKIREPLEIANARAEWERQKKIERIQMQKREAERLAQLAEREKKGPAVDKKEVLKSTDEWRRSIASGLDRAARPSAPAAVARPSGGDRRSHRASTHLAN
jgi:hypothetical protein